MLTDLQCFGSGGLYPQVSPAESTRWFLQYRIAQKEKQLSLGSYSAAGLHAAPTVDVAIAEGQRVHGGGASGRPPAQRV